MDHSAPIHGLISRVLYAFITLLHSRQELTGFLSEVFCSPSTACIYSISLPMLEALHMSSRRLGDCAYFIHRHPNSYFVHKEPTDCLSRQPVLHLVGHPHRIREAVLVASNPLVPLVKLFQAVCKTHLHPHKEKHFS